MSGFLLLLVIDWVMRQTVEGERTEDLDFADDIALLLLTLNHLQSKTNRLEDSAARVGLKLNGNKCKTLRSNSKREENLTAGNSEVENLDTLTYLAANVTKDGGSTADIKRRTALASASFRRLNNIWRVTDLSRKTKASLFKSLVLSLLLYGCETWKLTRGEEEKLEIFQTKCLRKIFRMAATHLKQDGSRNGRSREDQR